MHALDQHVVGQHQRFAADLEHRGVVGKPRAAGWWASARRESMNAASPLNAPPCHRVEHAVGELGVALVEERVGDVEVFADRGAGRHVGAGEQLVSAGAQDLQQRLVEPFEPPALGEPLAEQRVDLLLAGDTPLTTSSKKATSAFSYCASSISWPSRCWWNSSSSRRAGCPPSRAGTAPGPRRGARRRGPSRRPALI
jgi:hypothetical protein